jgi:hypothetical protein
MRARFCLVLAAVSLLSACSKSDSGEAPAGSGAPTVGSAASPAAASGGACDVVSCANFSGAPGYAAGKVEALPSIPPPPSGSSTCGGTASMRANYYTTTQSPEQIIAYYEKELPARGFTLKPRQPGVKACSLELSFHKEKLQIGNITAFAGGFGVLYAGK